MTQRRISPRSPTEKQKLTSTVLADIGDEIDKNIGETNAEFEHSTKLMREVSFDIAEAIKVVVDSNR